jgi:hypothetical protein
VKIATALICVLGLLPVMTSTDTKADLYAASAADGPGQLFRLNPATGGMLQDIGQLNDLNGLNYPVTGLAFNPLTGVLYGSTGNNPTTTAARLVTVHPVSGLVTVIGSFNADPVNSSGTPATMADIAFDGSDNLFGIGSIGGPQLYSINLLTGQARATGSTGLTSTSGGGLVISASGVFYGTLTASRFGTYDSVTGTYANIANPAKPAGGAYGALDFDKNGTFIGLNVGSGSPPPTHLATIDPTTGAVTDLGSSLNSLDAIAFSIVPEPGTMALCLAVTLALLARKWRRE